MKIGLTSWLSDRLANVNAGERRKFKRAVEREVEKRGQSLTSTAQLQTTSPKQTAIFASIRQLGFRGWALIVAIATIVTIAAGIPLLRSDVTIVPRVRLDPVDPFSTLYTVTNEGTFAIEDVRFTCHMNDVVVRNYKWEVRDLDGSTDPKMEYEVAARKSQDVACLFGAAELPIETAPNAPILEYGKADITMIVSYRPKLWWRRTQSERFIARTDGHGHIVDWSHQAG